MIIITIEECPSMPGRFSITIFDQEARKTIKERGNIPGHNDYAGAASAAVSAAMRLRAKNYCIFAPQKVLDFIPVNLRQS